MTTEYPHGALLVLMKQTDFMITYNAVITGRMTKDFEFVLKLGYNSLIEFYAACSEAFQIAKKGSFEELLKAKYISCRHIRISREATLITTN